MKAYQDFSPMSRKWELIKFYLFYARENYIIEIASSGLRLSTSIFFRVFYS